jgi:hypothetical protein
MPPHFGISTLVISDGRVYLDPATSGGQGSGKEGELADGTLLNRGQGMCV